MGRRTKQFERLVEHIEGKHAVRFDAVLETMDDETFALNYIKILEYVKPKLQRTDLSIEEEDTTINIIRSHKDSEDDKKPKD